jgi:aspartyl-tRNA(Asn)/glutamyl-tRNA(Gln) amidotransferase subunit A
MMYQTIHEAAVALREHKTTPLALVEQCLAAIDRWERTVRAWVFVDREGARAEAKRRTAEQERGQYRSPLHGIPIGVKDIFDVFDWPTAAGSALWANSIARQDADVVRNLRQAGAIFLGKTVTTQYASFDPPVTRNPWNLDHAPGGSSSGSAAALATGMCLGALGSQTGGSITRPASYCGVAGLKPTFGAISLHGIVPLAPSMDHPGPMARCAQDLALQFTSMAPPQVIPHPNGLDRPILGRLHGLFDERATPPMRHMIDTVASSLAGAGATVLDVSLPASFSEVIPRHRVIMAVEAAAFHRTRLHKHPQDYAPRIRELLEEGIACPAAELRHCQEHQAQLKQEMLACFAGVSALLTPATTGPAPKADTTGDPAFNSPWSYTGLPVVSIPTGQFSDGLPLAIQLIGKPGSELELVHLAVWCEKALGIKPLTPPSP